MFTALAIATAAGLVASAAAGTALAAPSPATPAAKGHVYEPAKQSVKAGKAVIEAARKAAFTHGKETGVGKDDKLKAVDALLDPEGGRHVRFLRSHHGLAVEGGDLVIHLDAKSRYAGVTRAYKHTLALASTTPALSAAEAGKKAAAAGRGTAGRAELVINATASGAALAYRVPVSGRGVAAKADRSLLLDATSGRVLSDETVAEPFLSPAVVAELREQGAHLSPKSGLTAVPSAPAVKPADSFPFPASGTGASLFAGSVRLTTTQTAAKSFLLKDPTRGGTETRDAKHGDPTSPRSGKPYVNSTNLWGNGTVKNGESAAADAQYGVTSTFDFYQDTFGRKGIGNDGAGGHAFVHMGQNEGNAYWDPDCGCMLYGDGDGETFLKPLVALDVTGHELTHGVVGATAALDGGEADGLNESLADIFGTGMEFATNNAKTPPNYLLGEQLGLEQKFLRRLDHPSLDKLEGAIDYWDKNTSGVEAHAASGVSSHAFYLLAEGSGKKTIGGFRYNSPTVDGKSVTGIGRDKALAVYYRALSRYMVSTTDFHDARKATLNAAADLYGKKSTEYKTVDRSWAAVNVTAANTPKH